MGVEDQEDGIRSGSHQFDLYDHEYMYVESLLNTQNQIILTKEQLLRIKDTAVMQIEKLW